MALTPDERRWLGVLREELQVAATRAGIYEGAVHLYVDEVPPWWAWIRHHRRRRGLRRAETKLRLYADSAHLQAAVVEAWCAAHSIISGEQRGPIIR